MSYTIIRPTDHEEWLKHRGEGIGSSEVATIVGLNPWETPYQLWRRKIGLDAPKEMNFAMRAGHYLEDAVAQFFADETKSEVIKSSAGDWLCINDEKPYLRVSPDRTFWAEGDAHNQANKRILEIKTTQMSVDPDDLPKYWFSQLQYQLGVHEMTGGALAWLVQGREFGYRMLDFVPDFYAWLVENVDRFYHDNILGGKEPESVNIQDVMLKYNVHTEGKSIEVEEDIYNAYTSLSDVRKDIKALEERKDALEEKIKMVFGDAESLTWGGSTIATWKAPKASKRFDEKAFKTDHPDLVEQYTREVQGSRRFLLK